MRRLLRWRIFVPTLVLLLAVGGWLYSRSGHAARTVAGVLESRFGTPVQIQSLGIGLFNTSFNSLQIFERDAGPGSEPWITVDRADFDLSPIAAAAGSGPESISLRDARVLLRFDHKGDLITKLPQPAGEGGAIPRVHIESGTLTLRQVGHPDAVFTGIEATLAEIDGRTVLTGTMADEAWGKWRAEGSVGAGETAFRLSLRTLEPHPVTPELLEKVPFVNPNAWRQVTLEGLTTAQLDLDIDLAADKVGYRITLEPTGTRVLVPSIGLDFADAAGTVVAEGMELILRGVKGKMAGGEVILDSRMDFSKPEDELRFTANMSGVDVRRLPKSWRVPQGVEGRLFGKTEFAVTVLKHGGVRTDGRGRGILADARINGLPAPGTTLELRPAGSGLFEFADNRPPAVVKDVTGVVAQAGFLAPPEPPIDARPEPKAGPAVKKPGLISGILKLAAKAVKPATALPDDQAYIHVNVTFRDVNIAELLKGAGVDLPARLAGKVTALVQIDIPTDTPDELAAYRLTGTASSKKLTIADLAVEDVKAKLNFTKGKLQIADFSGRLPILAGTETGGAISGSGELTVGKDYPFRGRVKLDRVALGHLANLKAVVPLPFEVSGEATATAALNGTLSPPFIRSSGEARAAKLQIGTFPVDDLAIRWDSTSDSITFREATAKLFGGEVTGAFEVPFRESVGAAGRVQIKDIDLAAMSKTFPPSTRVKLEGKAGGTVTLRVPAAGDGKPREVAADLELAAPKLKLQNVPAERIKGSANYVGGVLKYKLTGEALGGLFEVEGQYPSSKKDDAEEKKPADKKPVALRGYGTYAAPTLLSTLVSQDKKSADPKVDEPPIGRIRLKRVQLSRLLGVFGIRNTLGAIEADISGDFPLDPDDKGRLVGTGRLRADRIRWTERVVAGTGQGMLRLTSKEVRIEDIAIPMGGGIVRATVRLDRDDIDRSTASLTISNVPAKDLFFTFPDFASQLDLPVDGRFNTTIGREWRGSGVLRSTRGRVYGIPVSDLSLPIDWVVVPGRGRAELHLRDLTGLAASGRVTGRAEVNLFADLPPKLASEFRFTHLNATAAYRAAGPVVGSAPITGRLTIAADQLRTSNDLTGKLQATLGEAQPFGLPVLAATAPFFGLSRNASPSSSTGDLKATLGNGVWRVERFALSGPSIDLYSEGTVTTGGRLNLNVVGRSGRVGPGSSIISRLAAVVTQPLTKSIISDTLGALGNFVVYLEVTGTIQSPVVRLQTLRTISEDAFRFIIFRFIAP